VAAGARRVARPVGEPDVAIGGRLRAARQLHGLTLDQVAAASGLTKGFLSRLERDEVSPSVASLVTVCEVVGIRVGELFETPQTSLVRAGEGRQINFGGSDVRELLLTPGTHGALQVIHSTIEPGGNGGKELYTLDCEVEFAYVVAGRLRITLSGQSVVLEAGDGFSFPGREPHTWANDDPHLQCQVLWALAPAP
jgi:transcriptional regulator with XRE-family HTH domain